MKDILSNHKVALVRTGSSQSIGNATFPTTEIDLFSNGLANRALLIVDVGDIGTNGTLDLVVQDSSDDSTYDADFITLPQITETGLYVAVIDDPNRYLRVKGTAATDAVVWGATIVTFEEQRVPVTQSGTVLAGTYGTGRKPKVAAT